MSKLIMAVDTSTSAGSVAVLRDREILGEIYLNMNTTHSERVLKTIDILIRELSLELTDFDYFVSSIGPGSFTGIRIGLSILKGFALTLNKELIGVSSIDALAAEFGKEGKFIAFIEGRAKEIFYAFFQKKGKELRRISDYASSDFQILKNNKSNFGIFKSEEINAIAEQGNLFAHNFALLALENFNRYQPPNVTPLYIKKSDAEINYKKSHI